MNDLFAKELEIRKVICDKAIHAFQVYGYEQLQTPVLEQLSLFARSAGENSDIVSKEMYSLEDRDGTLLCMRPEGTAGAVRALVDSGYFNQDPEVKAFYIEPMFRRERPQKGRLREFTQIGAEYFGVPTPEADIEFLAMIYDWLSSLPIGPIELVINSLGESSERQHYLDALQVFYTPLQEKLCSDCQRRLTKNVLRLLDCKEPKCIALAENSPQLSKYLGETSLTHFETVQQGLRNLFIPFRVSNNLVRGLDYYTRTVFEFVSHSGLGAQNTIAGGGRYDGLVEELGGLKVPAIGMAAGLERLVILLEEQGYQPELKRPVCTLVYADEPGQKKAFELLMAGRRQGLYLDMDPKNRSVKSQMRRADRKQSQFAVVLGENEVLSGTAQLKSLADGNSQPMELTALLVELKNCDR
ncbi:MAG: histidine--tRNA ligase [Myxococcaceae bacterium]|nr:histidine--tRNA ligase [Myxococcaceae bacterium]MBH2006295.1 histidine--tRNA ligase [Myxococcaceae bacterium]